MYLFFAVRLMRERIVSTRSRFGGRPVPHTDVVGVRTDVSVTDLPVDWSKAIVYRRADSSRVAMVRLQGYLGEFGYNVRAKQYKGKLRAAYMACSPWLIVTVDRGTTKAQAIVSSAIPQVEYLADTHYPLRYISVLNTQKFSGDIVVFDVRRKPLYRICYTDGRIDDQREPMTIGIVHKVFTKNSEEDPYMLDDVVVIGHRPNQPSDDDFCLHNPELCGIGEIGPITGTDESDGPDQPPIPDGQDDNDQGQGSGGGGQVSRAPIRMFRRIKTSGMPSPKPDGHRLTMPVNTFLTDCPRTSVPF